MTEQDPVGQQDVQARLQEAVDAVGRTHSGAGTQQTRDALSASIAAAGLPEQPEKWLGDTAGELAAGRQVVVDRRLDRSPDADRVPDHADRTGLPGTPAGTGTRGQTTGEA